MQILHQLLKVNNVYVFLYKANKKFTNFIFNYVLKYIKLLIIFPKKYDRKTMES
jgi:hypothetical protein